MALLDDLVGEVRDGPLRLRLAGAVDDLKRGKRFGLVFEEHVPEVTALPEWPLEIGCDVQRRDNSQAGMVYRVIEMSTSGRVVLRARDGEVSEARPRDLVVVKSYDEPIFPALRPLGAVRRGPDDRPHHPVIKGENLRALQLLVHVYAGQVHCIYIDPPYNTGARDWKYNNRYVDKNDAWPHSKWLSFMEKRLDLAKRLLRPDGVLIVTIDEHEVHHLGVLLGQMFPDALVQMVTIAINPSGATGDGFSRVEEYAYYVFLGGARPNFTFEDFFGPEDKTRAAWWESLLRRGSTWLRSARPNLCYPILIDANGRIAGAGAPFAGKDESVRPTHEGKYELAWPVRTDGKLGIWRVEAAKLRELYPKGYAVATQRDPRRGTWSVRYLLEGAIKGIERGEIEVKGYGPLGEAILTQKGRGKVIPKTIWSRARHAAGATGGTNLLTAFLGKSGAFSYPKSVYAVRDALDTVVGNRPDALIVDFFAGSGTSLHATMLLNARDGGRRRCVLVTNNEVNEKDAELLHKRGHFRGDPTFEAAGVFESVTRPRITAAITGKLPDGTAVVGEYLDGREYAQGFAENAEFFELTYLNRDDVERNEAFDAILPSLWLTSGGVGPRDENVGGAYFSMPEGATYAVLFHPAGLRPFLRALARRPEITHVWCVSDTEEAGAELRAMIPQEVTVGILYGEYLRRFDKPAQEAP